MSAIRALIADDERPARQLLRSMLGEHDGVEVVAECTDGHETVRAIRRSRPDVAFLDIRMPKLDGLEVAASLERDERPHLVFVTAFDEFAVRAFELHALDYLLKPFDEQRLALTMGRVRASLGRAGVARTAERFEAFLDRLDRIGRSLERVAVKQGADTVILPLREVCWIESEANYVRLHAVSGAYTLRSTLAGLETRLDGNRFARIHRGTVVNVEFVERLTPCGRGDYTVQLRDGTELKLSRRFRERLAGLLGATT
jgi:two-component system LytT family response regulator